MKTLSVAEQIMELQDEFNDETDRLKVAPTEYDRRIILDGINWILDQYLDIELDTLPATFIEPS